MCGRQASELRYCCTAAYWCSRFHWSSSQVKHRRPCPKYIPTRSDESKSSVADGYQSIGEHLAKIVIDRTAARPVTWSKKRSITSFNASINLVATHFTIVLQACPRLFGRGKPPIYSSTPFGLALWRGLMAIRLQPSGRYIYPTTLTSRPPTNMRKFRRVTIRASDVLLPFAVLMVLNIHADSKSTG
jgi:hypothetical protein